MMLERIVRANGFDLACRFDGPEDGPVLLMIMGLAGQLIDWPDALIAGLNAAGIRTLRFDNRDVGLSAKLDGVRAPSIVLQSLLAPLGLSPRGPYDLRDMARDAEALVAALGLSRVHVAGFSMGGMIAQVLAAEAPGLVASLSLLSTATVPWRHGPRPEVRRAMLRIQSKGAGMAELIDGATTFMQMISTKGGGQTRQKLQAEVSAAFHRNRSVAGQYRQIAAILGTGAISAFSRRITAPTLVIHGDADPMVDVAGGRAIARAVPGARLEVIAGMGHDLPPDHLPRITDLIRTHVLGVQI